MKEVYAEYKDKGVEFVGISLDKPDQLDSLKEFVQDKQLSWIQTYSGQEWADPVARKYNIQGIPSMWVVNADGLVVNPSARGNLEQTLDVVLKKQAEEAGDTETTETAEDETAAE
jgi:peroxiredoxin